jgi:hypothetical protein
MIGKFILNWFICLVFFLPAWAVVAWSDLGGTFDFVITAAFAGFFSLLLLIDRQDEGRAY